MLFLKFNVLLIAWLIYLLILCVCISIGNLRDLPNFELTRPRAPSWGGLGCFFKCTWQGKHLTVFSATGTSPGQVESHYGFEHNQGCFFPVWASLMKTTAITWAPWVLQCCNTCIPSLQKWNCSISLPAIGNCASPPLARSQAPLQRAFYDAKRSILQIINVKWLSIDTRSENIACVRPY